MKKTQKGFTLIELMIVVAIIGILASISIPMYRDYTIRTRAAAVLSGAAALQTAITLAQNEGVPELDLVAAAGDAVAFRALGLRGAPENIPGVKSIQVLPNGIIEMTLSDVVSEDLNDVLLTLEPSFGATATTWEAELSDASSDAGRVVETYLERNVNTGLSGS